MRKHRAALHVTYYSDSKTLEAYVEAENVAGRWELISDDTSSSSSVLSGQYGELVGWLMQTMAGASSSTSDTSDVG